MRAVVQRCHRARVTVEDGEVAAVERGLVAFVAALRGDGVPDVAYIATKVAGLRIFPGADGRMALDVREAGGTVLLVSQFTLCGDVRRGRRPDFHEAAPPEQGRALCDAVAAALGAEGVAVATGRFGAMMTVF
jgi:D-tyrosyl-tRNA(Tyr) deacylase